MTKNTVIVRSVSDVTIPSTYMVIVSQCAHWRGDLLLVSE